MRAIQVSAKRTRNPRRRRATMNQDLGFSKVNKFEEFEDINLVDVQTPENTVRNAIERKSEISSSVSPRGAFDIVSEYLNHSAQRGRTFGSTNRIATFVSSPVSEIYNLCNPVTLDRKFSLCGNPKLTAAGSMKGRGGFRGRRHPPSTRRPSSRTVVNSEINSFLVFKRVKPLSEVNTNALIPKRLESDPVSVTESSKASTQSSSPTQPSNFKSMPFLKTLLTIGPDERSPSPVGGVPACNIFINHEVNDAGDIEGENLPDTNANVLRDVGAVNNVTESSPEVGEVVTCITARGTSDSTPNTPVEPCSTKPSHLFQPTPTEYAQDPTCVLSDVHTLIKCTALAGSELVENHGLANPSVISHISSAVLPSPNTLIPPQDAKRIVPKKAGRPRFTARSRNRSSTEVSGRFSKYAATTTNNTAVKTSTGTQTFSIRHPFMHFWESEDDRVSVSRGWRTRRSTYLSMLLACTDLDDITPDEDGGRGARRRSSDHLGHLLLHGLCKGDSSDGSVYARHLLEDNSSLLLAERTAQNQKMLSALEPTVLGYRWPAVTSATTTETDREVMLLWN